MDRKTIIAFVLIGAVILIMPYYFKVVSPEVPEDEVVQGTEVGTDEPSIPPYGEEGSTPTIPVTPPGEDTSYQSHDNVYQDDAPAPYDSDEKIVTVETPLYIAEFSTHGATVRSWRILPSQSYLLEAEQMVRPEFSDQNLTLTALGGLGLLRTRERVFELTGGNISLDEGDEADSLVFFLPLGEERWYKETFVFHADSYQVDIHLESRGLGASTGAISATYGWGGGLATTEADTTQDLYYTEASYYMGNKRETFKTKGKENDSEVVSGATKWVAQRTKYFVMALVPDDPAQGADLRTWPHPTYEGKYLPKLYETNLVFNMPQGDLDQRLTFYLGPLDQVQIKGVDSSLDNVMSWGWPIISTFSKGIFHLLKYFHHFIPNYGVVLILFSILVKLVVWPLTYKSHKSMKRMQMLQPILKETQEKYKDNPQRMQKEVMALYKEHKVNPMGGCWPMMLQMPLFYALFIVFRTTIELRGQPFVFWINDLSMPDVLFSFPFTIPLYGDHLAVLPLIMAASTYLQSKSTVTDPNQKMMTIMMPIMFIFLFNNFPSGLTLYYTLFNLLSWGQQKMMKTSDPGLEKLVEDRKAERELEIERENRRNRKKNRD
ncbi:MAG TPA: membrane protein insertase YidC [Bacteroidetes bacterium]|nr:membrane protein insertase YidC [bacterium BMS3Bbin04]HDO64656.1 membrane protein insertase YidC [Bacteroidota bacterium]HEX03781.1 membrane protein insertase YidC [Bacteroidota bacterium]